MDAVEARELTGLTSEHVDAVEAWERRLMAVSSDWMRVAARV